MEGQWRSCEYRLHFKLSKNDMERRGYERLVVLNCKASGGDGIVKAIRAYLKESGKEQPEDDGRQRFLMGVI